MELSGQTERWAELLPGSPAQTLCSKVLLGHTHYTANGDGTAVSACAEMQGTECAQNMSAHGMDGRVDGWVDVRFSLLKAVAP